MKRVDLRTAILGGCVLALILSVALADGGCRREAPKPFWTRLRVEDLSGETRQWVDWSLPLDAGQARTEGQRTYLLVTWGPRWVGDEVEIVEVAQTGENSTGVTITVRYSEGPGGGPETARPYDLAAVDFAAGEVAWVVEGDPERHVMQVLGEMRPIIAESRWIKLFGPPAGQTVSSPFEFSGLASVFEGTVNFRLVAGTGEVIVPISYTMAGMGDWGSFRQSIDYSLPPELTLDPATGRVTGRLEIFWLDAENGSERDKIVVPLQLGPS